MTIVWSSLAAGAIYALIAVGYNITYVWGGVLNFAQAQFVVLGAFIAYWGLAERDLPVLLVLLIAGVVCAGLGVVEERLALRPLVGRAGHGELITTVGAATVLAGAAIVIWGPDPLRVPPVGPTGPVDLLGGRVLPVEIFIMLAALAAGTAIHVWSTRAQVGLAGLARTEDREAAALRGVNVHRLSIAAFAAAGMFGGLVGVLVGPKTFAVASLGTVLAVKGFVALTLGGVGSQPGAIIGGLGIGLAEGLAARYIGPNYGNMTVFALFLVVLLVRPTGLFGRRLVRAV